MSKKQNPTKQLLEKEKPLKFWTRILFFIVLNNFFHNSLINVLEFFISSNFATIIGSVLWMIIIIFYVDTIMLIIKLLVNNSANAVDSLISIKLLVICKFLYSAKTQREVFEPIIADWQEEYFEALFKKEIWKARCINMRYIYAFFAAMWQKSPIGDLIEFVRKFAK
ncbi:hypothetical protein BH20ACI1_BH20ACI1_06570 [soil metagenome]